jgi:hypothetical protein
LKRLSGSFTGALRLFSYWVASGTVGYRILEGIDYRPVLFAEPSAMEQMYAIFANVIELDDDGSVLNAKYAERRAAQWLRSYIDRSYQIVPPLEVWECELNEPPPRFDPKVSTAPPCPGEPGSRA